MRRYDGAGQSDTAWPAVIAPGGTRIAAAGGWVKFNRVNGSLALSRALGDFEYKRNASLPAERQMVTALPDVVERELTDDVEFVVLACDGIWDVLSSQQVVDFCRTRLAAGMQPELVCESLLTRCLAPDLAGAGCDNMTVVLVCLLHDADWHQFAVSGMIQHLNCRRRSARDNSHHSRSTHACRRRAKLTRSVSTSSTIITPRRARPAPSTWP